jgi:predicted DNA-binding protein YlxM (UPF0122 family)
VDLLRLCFFALCLSVAFVTPAAAEPEKSPPNLFLGEKPGDVEILKALANDIRQFSAGERVALMEVTLLCELDRGALSRKRVYDTWLKRCKKTENIWNTKHRTRNDSRMIDAQMRLYLGRRLSLAQAASRYFIQKETIARKVKRREDVTNDVSEAVRLRKRLSGVSTQILRFFFALRDLVAESQK